MTTEPTFVVDKKGLAKLLDKRGKEFIVYELIQNAWDEETSRVDVTVEPDGARDVFIMVVDDNPEGFANLTHAYTLFAESTKKSDPEKRGRFNLGEKLVIALADHASIRTTKGTVIFNGDKREHSRTRTNRGTRFVGRFKMNRTEMLDVIQRVKCLLPPPGIDTYVNGELIVRRIPLAMIQYVTLPTEIADNEGYLRSTRRQTTITLYEPRDGEIGTLYELGIPVVETGDRWHIDIGQKVPLNSDRDNVTPAYLRLVRALVTNTMSNRMDAETAVSDWVSEALGHDFIEQAAVNDILTARFGEKRVVYDPSDPEGTKIAVSKGYTVIPGGAFNRDQWSNIRKYGAALPAGQVTPSPKPYSESGQPQKLIPNTDWTPDMRRTAELAAHIGSELLVHHIAVYITSDVTWPFAATYGNAQLVINLGRLGHKWFVPENTQEQLALVLHEFAHEVESDHLSSRFADAIAELGARLAIAVAAERVIL